jgi:hypothetical protein
MFNNRTRTYLGFLNVVRVQLGFSGDEADQHNTNGFYSM